MEFKVGDIVKKPNGNSHFKILRIRPKNRFGELFIENLMSAKKYWAFSKDNWVMVDPFKPKKMSSKDLKFNFKYGV